MAGFLTASCNKTADYSLNSPLNTTDTARAGNKVLLVIVDGLVGAEVRAASPVHLTSYVPNAIFSYDAINSYIDDSVSNAYGWTSLLTGVRAAKHQVTGDFDEGELDLYPPLISRMKQLKPALTTIGITTSQSLKDELLKDATQTYVFAQQDAQAFSKAKELLQSENPDLAVVQFSGVDSAGSATDYTAATPTYKQAINRIDAYIGSLVQTIQQRKNYDKEEWLVVVSSGKGSNTRYHPAGTAWDAFSDKMHNTFIMLYNPRFVGRQIKKPTGVNPYVGQTYNVKSGNANIADRSALASLSYSNSIFGEEDEFTMQCKVRLPKSANGSYGYISCGFLGFRRSSDNNAAGVTFTITGNRPALALRSGDGGSLISQVTGPTDVADDYWHTLTFVKRRSTSGTSYTGLFYMDGNIIGEIPGITASFNTESPLCVGMTKLSVPNPIANATYGTQSSDSWATTVLRVTDIRIYNTALTDQYIQNNYCAVEIAASDPYYINLLGFWKGTEIAKDGSSFYYPNLAANDNTSLDILEAGADGNFVEINETSNKVCPQLSETTYKEMMNTVDVTYQIYSWLGMPPATSWGLDGKVYLPKYIDISN